MGKHICGECEFYGKKDLCPWPKDCPWPRPEDAKQCRAYWLLVKTRHERNEAWAALEAKEKDYREVLAEIERLTRERDEARAEVKRQLDLLRKFVYEEGNER